MTKMRSWMILFVVALAAAASAQSWMGAYDKALGSAKKGEWEAARQAFQQAAAYRTEDVAGPTTLPGPATEQRRWRNGSPYSPNFLAAYAAYRSAITLKDATERANLLRTAAGEFETLLTKNQASKETYYFLNAIYTMLGDTPKRLDLEKRFTGSGGKTDWKVDDEIVAPEEIAAMGANSGDTSGQVRPTPNNPNPIPMGVPGSTSFLGPVPLIANKYALLIGNSQSRIKDAGLPYAADDAQGVREALITNAGYPEQNVDLVLNATADQIMKSAKALYDRMEDGATVTIYFTGVGVNIDGKDYLEGIDTEAPTDTKSMVSKSELYRIFMNKGAKIFAFLQANRPIESGRFFGQEIPLFGSLAQVQATAPGDSVFTIMKNGKQVGAFTSAFVGVLADFRSNRNPIFEFGWQVFYKIKRGDTGNVGGGSRQTPTLPVLTNMASDAHF